MGHSAHGGSLDSCCWRNCIIGFLNKLLAQISKSRSCRPWQVYFFFKLKILAWGRMEMSSDLQSVLVSDLKCTWETRVSCDLILGRHAGNCWLLWNLVLLMGTVLDRFQGPRKTPNYPHVWRSFSSFFFPRLTEINQSNCAMWLRKQKACERPGTALKAWYHRADLN